MSALSALRALGTGPEPPAEAKERVHRALLASFGAAALAANAASVAHQATQISPNAARAFVGAASSKSWVVAAGIWLAGGATGAALYGAVHREQVRIVYVDRPVLANPVGIPAKAQENAGSNARLPAQPSLAASAVEPSSVAATPRASAVAGTSDLARERALLDSARAAAAHGEPALELEQVEQHLRQFPHGRLAEEREALAIRALLSLGRNAEARARADAFHRAYPHSFLSPVIDSALSSP